MMLNLLTTFSFFTALTTAYPTDVKSLFSHRSIRPLVHPETPLPLTLGGANGTNQTATEYSSNWAGAVAEDRNVTRVTGTFTIPHTKAPANSVRDQQYGAAAWVGIDGWTCGSAILQTGVSMTVVNGRTTYTAWYEWYPDYMRTFSALDVGPGDSIRATVEARGTTSGSALVENLTTGKQARHAWRDASNLGKLCETDAEWIVEDFSVGGSLIPFADFGRVRFHNVSYVAAGRSKGIKNATLVDITNNNNVVTRCSTEGTSVVECSYLG